MVLEFEIKAITDQVAFSLLFMRIIHTFYSKFHKNIFGHKMECNLQSCFRFTRCKKYLVLIKSVLHYLGGRVSEVSLDQLTMNTRYVGAAKVITQAILICIFEVISV